MVTIHNDDENGEKMKESMEKLELLTEEYSVLITDKTATSCGTGILYVPEEGNTFYVFTCAHVLDELSDQVEVYLLLPVNREKEEFRTVAVTVSRSQIFYSTIDEVTGSDDNVKHSVDAAILSIPKEIPLAPTQYFVGESTKGDRVFAQGYPGGGDVFELSTLGERNSGEDLLENLDVVHGTVLHNVHSSESFLFRMEDNYVDSSNRVYELQGFSGSPVWNGDSLEISVLGLLAMGKGKTVYRGKLKVLKMEQIRSMMKIHFNIVMETRIPTIPEEDVASGRRYCGTIDVQEKTVNTSGIYDTWLETQTEKVREYMEDLKFQKAIDAGSKALEQADYLYCSKEKKRIHCQYLLYCYEVCYLDEEYYVLEQKMVKEKLLESHDPLRWMTMHFSRRNFSETVEYAKQLLEQKKASDGVLQIAELFVYLCNAYLEEAPVEDTILQFVDEQERLIINSVNSDIESLIYQMIGYVYGEHYHQYTKSVRCLNRSYRIGSNLAVLESLSCSYYFLAIQDALREDDTVDQEKLDRKTLNKARECFLLLLGKADNLYLSSMMKREGMVIFNTFYFLQDSYRILTLYPNVMDALPEGDVMMKRDLELKYARVLCRGGLVDLDKFPDLYDSDRVLINTLGEINTLMESMEFQPLESLRNNQIGEMIQQSIECAEINLNRIEEKERMPVRVTLMNLYGWKHRIFGLCVTESMEKQLKEIKKDDHSDLILTMENFLFENSHSLEEAEQRYRDTWNQKQTRELWMELLQFYKRNWMLDQADEMFRELFVEHSDYVQGDEEFAYRAYLDYILNYQRNLKDALRFYLTHKAEMKDAIISEFWEFELMMDTCSFNQPEKFEEERFSFVEQGLISINEYHRTSLIAYMCNLNSKKASEHYNKDNPSFGFFLPALGQPYLTKEGANYLVWQKKVPPHREIGWRGMIPSRISEVELLFQEEKWHVQPGSIREKYQLEIYRILAVDAWGLFYLAAKEQLELLEYFDTIYVTHMSVCRMLQEICHYENPLLETILAYLEVMEHIKLLSPDFEHQLEVRNLVEYTEPGSTIAMALEAGCPAVIGDPEFPEELIDQFGERVLRPSDLEG